MKSHSALAAKLSRSVLLVECGTCSLREATIVASVLSKNSVPLLHSAAAIIKIAEMDYSGANSIFLRTLLDKKYALPYQAVDAVVYHFIRFVNRGVFSMFGRTGAHTKRGSLQKDQKIFL